MEKLSEKRNAAKSVAVKGILGKLGQSYLSVAPILLLVTVLFFTGVISDFSLQTFIGFLICVVFVGLGLALFSFGVDESISKIGLIIGETLFKKRSLLLTIILTLVIGFLITVAEPDLKVMASQIGMSESMLIASVGVGVAIFETFGVLIILFNKSLNTMFLAFYAIAFSLVGIINPKFLPIAFDAGGVVTGPVTVPFFLAFGLGLASSRQHDGRSGEDSFGLTALATVGPIVTILILSLFVDSSTLEYTFVKAPLLSASDWGNFWTILGESTASSLLDQVWAMFIAIVPMALFFLIYDLIFVRLPFKQLLKVLVGFIYTYIGLVLFMSAVQIGLLPVGEQIGLSLGANKSLFSLAIGIGALVGVFAVLAEPAVHVLVKQIEIVSEGTIKSKLVLAIMALSIGGGVALAVVRAYYGFTILYFLVPGYFLAIGLSFVVPKIYSSMAFDSGSVAAGPMASSFVMPFCLGFAYSVSPTSDYIYGNAFGCVAMISLMPLIVIQLMGLYAELKRKVVYATVRKKFQEPDNPEIIYFGASAV